jgi:hypothetical protein
VSGHTPGPWFVVDPSEDAARGTGGWGVCILAGHNYIARMTGRMNDNKAANCHLVAAAPDLLDACKALVKHACIVSDEACEHEPVLSAQRAIDKAEGR